MQVKKKSFHLPWRCALNTYIDTGGVNGSYGPLAKYITVEFELHTKPTRQNQIRLVDTMKWAIIKFAAKVGNAKQNEVYVK